MFCRILHLFAKVPWNHERFTIYVLEIEFLYLCGAGPLWSGHGDLEPVLKARKSTMVWALFIHNPPSLQTDEIVSFSCSCLLRANRISLACLFVHSNQVMNGYRDLLGCRSIPEWFDKTTYIAGTTHAIQHGVNSIVPGSTEGKIVVVKKQTWNVHKTIFCWFIYTLCYVWNKLPLP